MHVESRCQCHDLQLKTLNDIPKGNRSCVVVNLWGELVLLYSKELNTVSNKIHYVESMSRDFEEYGGSGGGAVSFKKEMEYEHGVIRPYLALYQSM